MIMLVWGKYVNQDALQMAIWRRSSALGLVFHSDKGRQYVVSVMVAELCNFNRIFRYFINKSVFFGYSPGPISGEGVF